MKELLEKIDNLKESLDNEEIIQKIKLLNNEIKKDNELVTLIKEYKKNPTDGIKYKIYSNQLYKKYKESETDLNLLILTINKKLKTINDRKHCL